MSSKNVAKKKNFASFFYEFGKTDFLIFQQKKFFFS